MSCHRSLVWAQSTTLIVNESLRTGVHQISWRLISSMILVTLIELTLIELTILVVRRIHIGKFPGSVDLSKTVESLRAPSNSGAAC